MNRILIRAGPGPARLLNDNRAVCRALIGRSFALVDAPQSPAGYRDRRSAAAAILSAKFCGPSKLAIPKYGCPRRLRAAAANGKTQMKIA